MGTVLVETRLGAVGLGWAGRHVGLSGVSGLADLRGSVDTTKIDPIGLTACARLCGATLARAHARGGDVVAIHAYLGADDTFADALEEFAQVYADRAEQDCGQLQQAITEGKVPIQTGI